MLLGSDITLKNLGEAGRYFNHAPEPMLVLSSHDLFTGDAEYENLTSGSLERLTRKIAGRLPAAIDRYTGAYSRAFRRALGEKEFIAGFARDIRDGTPISYSVAHMLKSRSAFKPGFVYVPGNRLDLKRHFSYATGLKPDEITGDGGPLEFWQTLFAAHELWHLVRLEVIVGVVDKRLLSGLARAIKGRPDEYHHYQEILCDFAAMDMAREHDPEFQFRQFYIAMRMIAAVQAGSAMHSTGLALSVLSQGESLPRLALLQDAADAFHGRVCYSAMARYWSERHIEKPTWSQFRNAAKTAVRVSLRDMIGETVNLMYSPHVSDLDAYNAAATLCAFKRVCPEAVAKTLGPIGRLMAGNAEYFPLPRLAPEAPHYQAPLLILGEKTGDEEAPDGSKRLVRRDGGKPGFRNNHDPV